MPTYLVSYDAHEGDDYDDLEDWFAERDSWHGLDSVRVFNSSESEDAVTRAIVAAVPQGIKVLVVEVSGAKWAQSKLEDKKRLAELIGRGRTNK
jgi:hypothetical protein